MLYYGYVKTINEINRKKLNEEQAKIRRIIRLEKQIKKVRRCRECGDPFLPEAVDNQKWRCILCLKRWRESDRKVKEFDIIGGVALKAD